MHSLVGKRTKLAVAQAAVVLGRYPADEKVRVERGRRSATEKIPVCDVHHDRRRALSLKAHPHEVLQVVVKRDLHVRTGLGRIERKFADRPSAGIDLHPLCPGLTTQRTFMDPFDSGLADLVVRQAQERVGLPFPSSQVVVADRPHIADLMREVRAEGVDPRLDHLRIDARQGRCVQSDNRELFPCDPVLYGDRDEPPHAVELLSDFVEVFPVHAKKKLQFPQHVVDITGFLFDQANPVGVFVVCDDLACPVQDAAPVRAYQPDVDPVLFGQKVVFFRIAHPQLPHPKAEESDHGGHRAPEQQ